MDHNTIVEISAFSGLAGALLTQLISGLFSYVKDRREFRQEWVKNFKSKKIEIGEHLFAVNGETMSLLKKSIEFWKHWSNGRSGPGLDFLRKEREKIADRLAKINEDFNKYNLVGLYFTVNLSTTAIDHANAASQKLFIQIIELADRIKRGEGDMDELYGQYSIKVFDLCAQYQLIYEMLDQDAKLVREELLREYRF